MWKNKLCNSARISAILSRAIAPANSSSPIPISGFCNSSPIFNSCCSSRFLSSPRGESFASARSSIFPGSSVFPKRDDASLFPRNGSFFCSQSKPADCWNCGAGAEKTTPFLFCPGCRSVQPVRESIDYFQIFGLGRGYKVEVRDLEKKYKDWQKKLHPDLVHSKSQREREFAAEQSARVIDAYRTLTDPLSRAIYILKLEGVIVDEEERITDPDLLAEVMELREAVDEANDTLSLKVIQEQLQEKLRYWANSFEDSYLNRNFEGALASIRRMTYYKRTNEEIVKKV